MNDCRIFVPVSNRFQWELGPFFHLFNKFWDANLPVTVLSSRKPNFQFENLEYVQVPGHLFQEGDWYWGLFGNGIKWFLEQIPESNVIIMMADHWPKEPVDTETIAILLEYASDHKDVFRISLFPHHALSVLERTEIYKGVELWECPGHQPGCFLLMSLVPAIWNRDLLIEAVKEDCGPWEFEALGSNILKAKSPGLRHIISIPQAIYYAHVARTRAKQIHLSAMPANLAEEIKKWIPSDIQVK